MPGEHFEMDPSDWAALKMLPPSENHDAFHQFLNLNGSLSPAGMATLKLADVLVQESARRIEDYQRKWGERGTLKGQTGTNGASTEEPVSSRNNFRG